MRISLAETDRRWRYILAGRTYHGEAINPKSLSIFERYALRLHKVLTASFLVHVLDLLCLPFATQLDAVLLVQSCLCSLACAVLPVQSCLCSPACAVLPVQSCLCSPACAVLPVQSCLCSPACAVLPVLPQDYHKNVSLTAYHQPHAAFCIKPRQLVLWLVMRVLV